MAQMSAAWWTASVLWAVLMLPVQAQPDPLLEFEILGTDQGARARLGSQDGQLHGIAGLVGLEHAGAPIRVVLASEDTDVARGTASWIAGFAHGASDTVVLFPARSLRYPHDSLESVLHHEVAHILIHRAAGGQPVPRWFNEGLATVAERAWHFEDRRQLAWLLLSKGPVGLSEIDALFRGDQRDAAGAYALSSAFLRDVIDAHGPGAPSRILAGVAAGAPFPEAFLAATEQSLSAAERDFVDGLRSWERWVPLLTSPFVLWTVVTLLALYAIAVRRHRRAERRRRWDEEEAVLISTGAGAGAAPADVRAEWPRGEGPADDESPPHGERH